MKNKKMGLTSKILLGLLLGLITGVILNKLGPSTFRDVVLVKGLFTLGGGIFVNAIKMLVVPLVLVSIINGAASMSDIKKLGRVGTKALSFYLATTAVAITIAILLSLVVQPGLGLDMSSLAKTEPTITQPKPFIQILIDMVPTNPVASLANGEMLQIIVYAMLAGVGLAAIREKVPTVLAFFEQFNELNMKIVDLVMLIAPYGVFCLIAKTFSGLGIDAMFPLAKYMLCVIVGLILHAIITYGGMLTIFTRLNPIVFLKKFWPTMGVAFSTSSSNATLPVTLETTEKKLGVSKSIASFTIPLGATINMDGTAIMQGAATIFISQLYGMPLTLTQILTVIFAATLASIGTAGVPGVGLVMLSMVLTSVGLPVEGIAIIIGIDRILDMCRTVINITGDAVCTVIVAKSEGEFDQNVYYSTDKAAN